MAYRHVLAAARSQQDQPPVCPDHPTSRVQWSNVRESWNCSTCRKDLGNPDPDFVGVNELF